jgi:methylenetetrahydrofolate dehydrogenase (NADP+) / methenyltetrahydrofolate cyclohydrolase
MAQILDGKRIRDQILADWKPRVDALAAHARKPGLAVVLVGDDPASGIYVKNKVATSHELGIYSEKHTPPASITTAELLALIDDLNRRPEIDGILVQSPLPKHIDHQAIVDAVRPDKDVDAFHPVNVGKLVANLPAPRPCTPAGVIELLKRYKIPIAGKHAVVVGRSDIVGKPMALLLLHEHATVTICHSRTKDLPAITKQADILVAAIGRPAFLGREHIKDGAVVIDVGINRLTDEAEIARIFAAQPERSRKLIGDVHPLEVEEASSAYTPVPGGVGPLTIAMLMVNTILAAEAHIACSASA